ncbi:pentapeptide repeat-containing protein [Kitasatospora sp. NBC_01287]|uniref:pentapeptide repeat-containing protein n=1 Tax=Kitasatospora sp. NBC_01287 TaxID=2903573 RepID=UPI002259E204|nr:pentapeptide repeat-containing protein [Kitasatospora sp. NBC_01287]MCX4748844.1 pentapeptide repeat-containing protein [Kitasatospora sp. NBC_01287]
MPLADQPYAHLLRPHPGPLRRDERYDTAHFERLDLEQVQAGGALFLECAFTDVTFSEAKLRQARFNETWWERCRLVASELVESEWQDTTVQGGLFAGVSAYGAQLRRMTVRQCKLESVNLRGAVLRDVVFEDCQLRDVDFGGAKLTGVSFPGSSLDEVRFGGATLARTDLRGASRLGLPDGHEGLRGAVISATQLIELAPQFAQALGVQVRD